MKRQLKFGIEIEVATKLSRQTVIDALKDAGINVESAKYGSAVIENTWKVQPDGSINGWEIVSPPQTDTEELEKVCYVLRKVLKVKGSPRCGLHVHHDINDFTIEQIKNVYRLYNKYENNAIKSIMRKQRQNNGYCQPINYIMHSVESANTIEEFKNSVSGRYYTVNSKAYVKYGTIEFRHHHGTSDINEVLTWLEITHKIVEAAGNGIKQEKLQSTTYEQSLQEMFNEIGLENTKIQKLAMNRRKAIEKMDGRRSEIA